MTKSNQLVLVEGEEWFYLSIDEVTTSFGISVDTVLEIIDEGIVTPQKNEHDDWVFDSEAYCRIRMVLQLNRDLRINFSGAGLVIELLNEIDRLHALLGEKRK